MQEQQGREAFDTTQGDPPGYFDPTWDPYAPFGDEAPGWMDYLRHPGLWILAVPILVLLGLTLMFVLDGRDEVPEEADVAGLLAAERMTSARPDPLPPVEEPAAVEFEEADLSIVTSPPGARVLLDEVEIGASPVTRRLETGVYFISIEKDGYVPLDTFVYVLGKEPVTSFFFLLDPVGSNASRTGVATASRPSLVEERSWGAPPGDAPAQHEASGESARSQSTPSRSNVRTPAEAGDQPDRTARGADSAPASPRHDKEEPATEAPPPATGSLTVLVRPWGSIYIDGVLHRRDADVQYTTTLPAGSHRIRVEHPVLGVREEVVQVEAGEPHRIVFNLIQP